MTPKTHHQTNPSRNEARIFRAVVFIALLAFGVFVAFDGQRFYARYTSRCVGDPDRAECNSRFGAKPKPQPELGIALDHDRGKWAIQLAALDENTANETASRLREAGANPRLIKTTLWTRESSYYLQLGRFKTQREAVDAGNQLKARGLLKSFAISTYRSK